ncbi:MAG TPA: ATP-binding protein [Bacteroidales bacterium]|nr:ATP-binding protein [Bacteroidales bacterium]
MKETSPSRLALYNALLIVIIFAILRSVAGQMFPSLNVVAMLVLDAVLFVLIFISFQYTLKRFIYQKIKLIYKTIYNLKRKKGDKDERRYFDNKTIDSVNQEVQEWGESRKLEIEQLKQNEKYRREFLGNIYHELKTPIFNIQGYVLTLLDGGLEDPAINRDYLLRTSKNINRMIAIVEDLETISNLETSQIALNFAPFDIVELAAEVFDFLEIKARKRKHELTFAAIYDSPILVFADKKWIRQVLVNLVENTIKYASGKAGLTRLSFFDLDENILVEMTDDGPGIAAEEIPRIFERFYRTHSARSREKSGTGLGLAIVKHIIDAHDQTINVRSRLGVGTTFAFTLKKGGNRM